MFKRPEPADLFRTMEDASGVDLDWFWRGWFFTTDHTDMALTGATRWTVDTQDPTIEKERQRAEPDVAVPDGGLVEEPVRPRAGQHGARHRAGAGNARANERGTRAGDAPARVACGRARASRVKSRREANNGKKTNV